MLLLCLLSCSGQRGRQKRKRPELHRLCTGFYTWLLSRRSCPLRSLSQSRLGSANGEKHYATAATCAVRCAGRASRGRGGEGAKGRHQVRGGDFGGGSLPWFSSAGLCLLRRRSRQQRPLAPTSWPPPPRDTETPRCHSPRLQAVGHEESQDHAKDMATKAEAKFCCLKHLRCRAVPSGRHVCLPHRWWASHQ